jgi:hypothetical protein
MTRHSRFVWIVAVALGLASACGPITNGLSPSPSSSTSSSPTGSTPSSAASSSVSAAIATDEATAQNIALTPNPLNVQVTLDTANAQTGVAPVELTGQTANGTTFALLVPEELASQAADGMLVPAYGTPVTLTPVSAIEGIPFSQGFLAAVQLAPHGLSMIEPAALMLTIPGEYAPGDLVGFAWDGSGNNFHLYPANIFSAGGTTTVLFDILLIGGDGVGVAPATPEEVAAQHAHVPEGETNQDDDLLSPLSPAKFLELERQQQKITNDLSNILSDQLLNGITRGNCNDADVLSQRFITWHARVLQVEGGEDHFKNSIELVVTALRPGLDACLKSTCSVCMGTPPGNKQSVDAFLIHAFYAEQLANIAGDSSEAGRWQTLGDLCAENAGRPLPHPPVCEGSECREAPVSGPTATPPVCP